MYGEWLVPFSEQMEQTAVAYKKRMKCHVRLPIEHRIGEAKGIRFDARCICFALSPKAHEAVHPLLVIRGANTLFRERAMDEARMQEVRRCLGEVQTRLLAVDRSVIWLELHMLNNDERESE